MAKHRRSRRHNSNLLKKTMNKSVSIAKATSRKFMPKIKSGLENVGSKVIKTGENSVPFLQRMTRKLFSMFSKTRRRR
jgi:hypothetical protein